MFSHHLCSERVSVPTPMVSYYHHVISLPLSVLTHPPSHLTPMVSYYHQVISLPTLRELVLPLISLPWCPTTTMSSHTHTNPCAPTHPMYHVLTYCAPLTSFSPPMHHHCITNHLPHSPTHHASITSSSHHPIASPQLLTNRFLSLHTTRPNPPNRLLIPPD